jgi:release factor glutamine methyltransferase
MSPATALASTPTIADCLQQGARALASRSESPRLDAELLLCHVLGVSRSALIVRGTDAVNADDLCRYDALIAQRAARLPIAYLTGSREFWSLDLRVTPDVLVPRPETELLVELALQRLPKDQPATVLDLGTGSGAVALAIATERPLASIIAVDLSPRALAVASENAVRLGLTRPGLSRPGLSRPGLTCPGLSRIEFRAGSWFDAVPGVTVDLIVSNPPYIASNDPALDLLAHEPALALASGPDGLDALKAIALNAAKHLNPGGWLILEHGFTQNVEVAALLRHQGFDGITSHVDYSGKPRVTLGTVHHTRDTYQ